jgi:hypothetical protein
MAYCLKEIDDYEVIKVPRRVVTTKEGKKVELYPFNVPQPQSRSMLLFYLTKRAKVLSRKKLKNLLKFIFNIPSILP